MTEKKGIHFLGLLSNVDSSILDVKLDMGFKIESMGADQASNFVSRLENLPSREADNKLYLHYAGLHFGEKMAYFVTNNVSSNMTTTMSVPDHSSMAEFDNKFVQGYLRPTIQLMRLFKEGNVTLPSTYYYLDGDAGPQCFMRGGNILPVTRGTYSIRNDEIGTLQSFLHDTKLPFGMPFLQLAFENFELSYLMNHHNIQFLVLMISLEVLLNPSDHELRNRISRNAAILLGKDKTETELIYREVKYLYDKRSELVHNGKSNITPDDVIKLRNYVREAIKTIHKKGESKDVLMELLNSMGFDDTLGSKIL